MDLPNLSRNLHKLATADAVVVDSYLRYALKKGALYLLACFLAIGSISLLGLSLYWVLEQSMGATASVALIGLVGLLLAAVIAIAAMIQRPGRDFSLGLQLRQSSMATLEQSIGQPSPNAYLYPAGEAIITSIVIPLLGTLLRSLGPSHHKTAEKPAELDAAKPNPELEPVKD